MKSSAIVSTIASASLAMAQSTYELSIFDQPGYLGQGATIEPDQCLPLASKNLTAQSIEFTGDNCCFFFATPNCDNMQMAQRIVGDIPNTSTWGFPRGPGAVKCLTKTACEVLRNYGCSFDAFCATSDVQGQCPFTKDCTAYTTPQPEDWQQYTAPLGTDPIKARFFSEDMGTEYVDPPTSAGSFSDNAPVQGRQGGTDNYDQPVQYGDPWQYDDEDDVEGWSDEQERQWKKVHKESSDEYKKKEKQRKKEEEATKKAQRKKEEAARKQKKKESKAKAKAEAKVNGKGSK